MDCIVHGVTKSQIQLSDFHFDENLNVFTWTFSNGKRCAGIGFFSSVDREIGVFRHVAPPTRLRFELPHETGLILRTANRWENNETVTDFIFLGSKITADGDCSHKIKRCLPLGVPGVAGPSAVISLAQSYLLVSWRLY